MIKIIIADDLSMLRQGIQVVLETDSEIKVCGLASNGKEAFELCKEHLFFLVRFAVQWHS